MYSINCPRVKLNLRDVSNRRPPSHKSQISAHILEAKRMRHVTPPTASLPRFTFPALSLRVSRALTPFITPPALPPSLAASPARPARG